MKALLMMGVLLAATSAFAEEVTCTSGEMYLTITIKDLRIVKADWSNPDWGGYGAHLADPRKVTYTVTADYAEAVLAGDAIPDANATYVCH